MSTTVQTPYKPQDPVEVSVKTALAFGMVGVVVSAIQNAISPAPGGSATKLARSGNAMALFGKEKRALED
jgi:hypothetical protein